MKLLAHGEARNYYSSIWRWDSLAGIAGLSGGIVIISACNRFSVAFRVFTPSIKSSLAIYPGILAASAGASHATQLFELHQHPEIKYVDATERIYKELKRRESPLQRMKEWGYEHGYKLCAGTWAATMMITLGLLRRDRLMTGTQNLVQARVVAQASTIGMLLLTTAMELRDVREGRGKYEEVVVVDPRDPRHQQLKRLRLKPILRERPN